MRPISLLAILFLVASTAEAQDAVKVDSIHHKVEFENARVRVLRVYYGPHEKSPLHYHPSSVIVLLTNLDMKLTYPDGKSEEVRGKTGGAGWAAASRHVAENLSDSAGELIQVELKGKP